MEKRIIELYRRKFDDIRHEEDGIEYWYARELMTLLDYVQWRNFENVVKKGMLSCKNNGIRVEDHFAGVSKMVTLGSGANREVVFKLSRFGRNAADVLSSLQLMQDYGVNLICVEDGIDSSKEAGKLLI